MTNFAQLGAIASQGPSDSAPPTLTWAVSADGLKVIGTPNEPLQPGALTPSQFAQHGTHAAAPTAAVSTGLSVELSFATNLRVAKYETVTIDYTSGASPIRDLAGNVANNFAGVSVAQTANTFLAAGVLDWDPMDSAAFTLSGSSLASILNRVSGVGSGALTGATPTYSATAWKSKPGLSFNAAASQSIRGVTPFAEAAVLAAGTNGNNRTVLAACSLVSSATRAIFAWRGAGANGVARCGINTTSGGTAAMVTQNDAGGTAIVTGSSVAFGTGDNVVGYSYGSALCTIQKNAGLDPASNAHAAPSLASSRYSAGAEPTGISFWNGVIARIVVLNAKLLGSDLSNALNYIDACGPI